MFGSVEATHCGGTCRVSTLVEVQAWFNPANGAVSMDLVARPGSADLSGVVVEFLDEAGERLNVGAEVEVGVVFEESGQLWNGKATLNALLTLRTELSFPGARWFGGQCGRTVRTEACADAFSKRLGRRRCVRSGECSNSMSNGRVGC